MRIVKQNIFWFTIFERAVLYMKFDAKTMTRIAVMTAVICILGPVSIPIGPVPISLTPLTILLSVYLLGMAEGACATLLYVVLGAIGLPVFGGFTGGFGIIAGPTGGYIIGYVFLALIAGWFIHKYYDRVWLQFLGMCLGTAVLYAFGTVWLAKVAGMTFMEALAAGVLPFIAGDVLKMVLAIALGRAIRSRLESAGLIVR